MKKIGIVFSILTIIFLAAPVEAQNIYIGPLAGLNLADVDIDIEGQDFTTSFRPGFTIGGVFNLVFSDMASLQFEPAYMQKGAQVEMEEVDNGQTFKIEQTLKADYIDIPVLLKISFGQGIKPYLLAGPYVAFKLGDAKIEMDKVTVNGQDVTNQIPADEREDDLKTKSVDFGLNFGAGVIFPLGNNHLFFEGQYSLGLTNLNDEDDSDEVEVKAKGIQIKVGILFPLGN